MTKPDGNGIRIDRTTGTIAYHLVGWEVWFMGVYYAGIAMIGAFIIWTGWQIGPLAAILCMPVGALVCVLHGVPFMAIVRRAMTGKPALALSPEGLAFDEPFASGMLMVPWLSVRRVDYLQKRKARALVIHVDNEAGTAPLQNRIMQRILMSSFGNASILTIPDGTVSASLSALQNAILDYRLAHATHESPLR